MSVRMSAAAVAGGLLLGVVPGLVTAGAAHAATTTKIGIRPSHSVYVAGQAVRLGVHLVNAPGGAVTFYQTVPGHSARKIYSGKVDSKGYEHIYGPANYNSTFTVKYAGDAEHAASQASTKIKVRAKVVLRAYKGRKAGKYRSYAANKRAVVVSATAPAKAHKKLTYRLERRNAAGHWKFLQSRKYKLNSKGADSVLVRGKSGHKYRMRASYSGDAVNAGNTSAWVYLKFRK